MRIKGNKPKGKNDLKKKLKNKGFKLWLRRDPGSTADGCTELKLVFDLINRSHRSAGKEPIHFWFSSV